MFITLDGGDGCGKTTQLHKLADYLQTQEYQTVICRDPGSTSLGDAVRNILLNRKELQIADLTETFLFTAARCQLLTEVVRPALQEKKIVLSDRFVLSTLVYQGYAGGVPLETLKEIVNISVGATLPDIGFVLDIPYEIAVQRIGKRAEPDRMEGKGEEYHRKVREGFLKLASQEPSRYKIIDASQTPDEVEQAIRLELINRLRG
ncbi:thymidylate kinase [Planctomycetales bacterium]|nr:thymidylate kinase [Planctomycetales bacterium]